MFPNLCTICKKCWKLQQQQKWKERSKSREKPKRNGNTSVYQRPMVFESNNVNNLKVNRATWNDILFQQATGDGELAKEPLPESTHRYTSNVKPKSKDLLNKSNSLSSHHITISTYQFLYWVICSLSLNFMLFMYVRCFCVCCRCVIIIVC